MHIITFLLGVTQEPATNIWQSCMDAPLVGAIMSTNFKIEELSMSAQRASCIPNHYIYRGIRSQIHTIFPRLSTATHGVTQRLPEL